jgi:hypothetical protein
MQNNGGGEWTNHARTLFESHPMFRPENIFWKPEPVSIPASWHDLWIQTIDFAGFLVRKKESLDFPFFIKNCIRQVNEIQEAAKSKLFSKDIRINQAPAMPVAEAGRQNEIETTSPGITDKLHGDEPADRAIAAILKQIKSKWERGALPEPSQDEDVMETIVLSSTQDIKPPTDLPVKEDRDAVNRPVSPAPPMADQHEFDQMQETTVIHTQTNSNPESSNFKDIEETIVMNTAPKTKTPEAENDFNSLDKTIILSSGSALPSDNTLENRGDFFSEDDDFDETVILPPKK